MNTEISSIHEARQLLRERKITADSYSQTISRIRALTTQGAKSPSAGKGSKVS